MWLALLVASLCQLPETKSVKKHTLNPKPEFEAGRHLHLEVDAQSSPPDAQFTSVLPGMSSAEG